MEDDEIGCCGRADHRRRSVPGKVMLIWYKLTKPCVRPENATVAAAQPTVTVGFTIDDPPVPAPAPEAG